MKTPKLIIHGVTIGKHGVRINGKYSPAWYSKTALVNGRKCVTIYAKNILKDLPRELGRVENNTETMTDYFETDRVRFIEGTPEYSAMLPLTV